MSVLRQYHRSQFLVLEFHEHVHFFRSKYSFGRHVSTHVDMVCRLLLFIRQRESYHRSQGKEAKEYSKLHLQLPTLLFLGGYHREKQWIIHKKKLLLLCRYVEYSVHFVSVQMCKKKILLLRQICRQLTVRQYR